MMFCKFVPLQYSAYFPKQSEWIISSEWIHRVMIWWDELIGSLMDKEDTRVRHSRLGCRILKILRRKQLNVGVVVHESQTFKMSECHRNVWPNVAFATLMNQHSVSSVHQTACSPAGKHLQTFSGSNQNGRRQIKRKIRPQILFCCYSSVCDAPRPPAVNLVVKSGNTLLSLHVILLLKLIFYVCFSVENKQESHPDSEQKMSYSCIWVWCIFFK